MSLYVIRFESDPSFEEPFDNKNAAREAAENYLMDNPTDTVTLWERVSVFSASITINEDAE